MVIQLHKSVCHRFQAQFVEHFQKFGSKWRRACAVARKISKMAASFCKKMYGKEYILIICGRSKHIALGARLKTVTVKLNLCNHSNNDEL